MQRKRLKSCRFVERAIIGRRRWLIAGLMALLISPAAAAENSFGGSGLPVRVVGQSPARQTRTSLAIEANVFYGDEDEEIAPVAADFYLLDASLIEILKAANFKPVFPDKKKRRINDIDYLEAAANVLNAEYDPDDGEAEVAAFLIDDLINKHASRVIKTNHLGDGYAPGIVPGNYYLFGIGSSGGQIIVWHQPVNLKTGINRISLDQQDAELIF